MILNQHGIAGLPSGGGEQSVTIGGITYPVVQIGGQLWLAKNLENEVGTLNTDYRVYDKSIYGLLYIVGSSELSTFLTNVKNDTGYHIPNTDDLRNLRAYCQNKGWTFPQCVKKESGWDSNNGTNESGLSIIGSGDFNGSAIEHIGTYFHGLKGNQEQYYISQGTQYDINPGYLPTNYGVAIRLFKNATENIGGRDYKVVTMPDGKVWMAENLDFKFEGCTIGSGTSLDSPRGNYYNNDESTYGWNGRKCGLLYNYPAVKHLNDNRATLIPGWHVASSSEWDNLSTVIGGTNNAPKLKSVNLPWTSSSWNGTDIYSFTVLPGGACYPTAFDYVGSGCLFATSTPYMDGFSVKDFSTDEHIRSYNMNANTQCYIRLVKD